MSSVLILLLLLAVVGLVWGLFAPHHIARAARIKHEVTRKHTTLVFAPFALLLILLIGTTSSPRPQAVAVQQASLTERPIQDATKSQPKSSAPTITTKQETETQTAPFTTQDQDTSTLAKGQTKTIQQGKDGIETLTYTVTLTNGVQTAKTLVSTVVTTAPITQIIEVGTYVAPAASTPKPTPAPTPVPTPTGCHPLTSGGNCYEPGEYCSNADHGMSGVAGDGKSIMCEDNNGWRWEPV